MIPSNKQQTIAFFISALASHPHIDPPLPAPCSPASRPLPPLVLLGSRLPVPLHCEKNRECPWTDIRAYFRAKIDAFVFIILQVFCNTRKKNVYERLTVCCQ